MQLPNDGGAMTAVNPVHRAFRLFYLTFLGYHSLGCPPRGGEERDMRFSELEVRFAVRALTIHRLGSARGPPGPPKSGWACRATVTW